MQPHIAVIGAGLAGLTAAATAARAGAAVTVVEARSHAGGRARSTVTDHGFVFNQGPHALYRAGAAAAVLADLGIEPRGQRPPTRGWGRLRGRLDRLPAGPLDALRTRLVGLRTKVEVGRALAKPATLVDSVAADMSLQQWIEDSFADGDARLVAAMLARISTYCADLDRLDARAGVEQLVAAVTDGVLYLDGGWAQLVDGLARACTDAGAKFAQPAKVGALARDRDGFTFDLDGATVVADAVIVATGGPAQALGVVGSLSAELQAWAGTCRPVYAASLDLSMRDLPRPDRRFGGGVDEPLYFSVHTPSARLAPPTGGEVLHVMRYGPGAEDARPELEAFLDDVQPGWRAHVIDQRYGRQLVVAHDRPQPGAPRRGPVLGDCPGLFVAGDWASTVGMLADAAVASGAEAARQALA